MKSVIAFFVNRGLLVNMLSIMLLLAGIYAASSIQREAFPSVNFDLVTVTAGYPGASPHEVEQLIVSPIERELKGLDGIKTYSSTSYPGSMNILIEISPEYKDRARLVSDIQQAVNRASLPQDLPVAPIIMEVKSEQTPVISFSLLGDLDEITLKQISDHVEDDLLSIAGVSKVFVQGDRKEEIRVTLDPEKMQRYRVSVSDVMRLIRGWNVNAPGGSMVAQGDQKTIRINGEFTSAEDAAALVIRSNHEGNALYLRDIATVEQALERPRRYVDSMGKPAMNFIIMKRGDADIIELVDAVRQYLPTIPERYNSALEIHTYQDFSINTRLRLNVLTSNGMIGLALVFICLFLFLRPSVAITTAWGLPIIFFSGLLILYLLGTTLNLLTMFGFIIVLGLMVDDAIIIGENSTWHMERGLPPREAAIVGTYELLGPVTATVLTTIVAFLPMMFMDGIIGKFVYSIPVVVVILLFFSWIEAIFILPNHICDLANAKKHPKERTFLIYITQWYGRVLARALKWRYFTAFLTITALIASGIMASQMKFQLFPPGAEDQFYLRVSAPVGTTLPEMRQKLLEIDAEVRAHIAPNLLETTITMAGMNSADERESLKSVGDHFGFVRVALTSFVHRTTTVDEVMEILKKQIPQRFPNLEINFVKMASGPPTGRALQVEISGGTTEERELSAQKLIVLLQGIQGAHSIESNLQQGNPEIHVQLDREKAAYAKIDLSTVATHVRVAYDGLPVSTLKRGNEEIDVTLRFSSSDQTHLDTLKNLQIPNALGGLIPLYKVATFTEEPGVTAVHHKAGVRVVHISAEVKADEITSAELNAQVLARESEWFDQTATSGIHYRFGGEKERTDESVSGLIYSFIFALLGIFVILAIQFNRISYPFLVMLAIPFGMIGIVTGLLLHGQPISFMSLMGFVALTGVVVNSSLVMAVFIQRQLDDGVPWFDAILDGGKRRLRAVLLTAITTVVGLLPTAYGWGGMDPFVAPMALALSWGLIFSTFITLFSVPATLAIALDMKRLLQRRQKSPDAITLES
ncbi:MAG: efflux RND transporter permease subunit [Zetaproteobacteria bacterium]|nr:efflux RND transporter permease subunit [Zetaproteobacteria bacterium]